MMNMSFINRTCQYAGKGITGINL